MEQVTIVDLQTASFHEKRNINGKLN